MQLQRPTDVRTNTSTLTLLLVAAAAGLSACQGGTSGSFPSEEWTAISEAQSTIEVRWPGISGPGQRRIRSQGYRNYTETANWGGSTSFPYARTMLRTANPSGSRFFVRTPNNSLESVLRQLHGNPSMSFGDLRKNSHRMGEVEYLSYDIGNSAHCLGLRAYDGTLPADGFGGRAAISDSLGKSVVYGLYCVKNRSSLTATVQDEVVNGISIKRTAYTR